MCPKLVNKSKFSKGAHTTNFAIWPVPYVCAQPYDPGSDNNGSFLAPSPSEFKTARQKLELAIFLFSIYTLSDLGDLSNLIGSLSRTI